MLRPGAGIGLRAAHHDAFLAQRPSLALVEVHSENFFDLGGPGLRLLDAVRAQYPLSLHGVGLSLGSATPLDARHLRRLCQLVRRLQPALVSEHLCWNRIGDTQLHDLLPLPHHRGLLAHLSARIHEVQDWLQCPLLIENIASYLRPRLDQMSEVAFLCALARHAGCRLLLDLNNIEINAHNHGFDARAYVAAVDPALVGELHLAGSRPADAETDGLMIDSHDAPVSAAGWALYRYALQRFGPRPTVIEWDTQLPELDVLLGEAAQAQRALDGLAPFDVHDVKDVRAFRLDGWVAPRRVSANQDCLSRRSKGRVSSDSSTGLTDTTPAADAADRLDGHLAELADLQRRFAHMIQQREPALLLADLTPGSGQAARCAVYHNHHHRGLREALEQIYPVTRRLLGDACFELVARNQVSIHGKQSGCLQDSGSELAEVLACNPALVHWPYLADVARLEWLWHQLWFAPDPSPGHDITLAQLAALDDRALEQLRLALRPNVRLYQSDFPVPRIHAANQPGAADTSIDLNEGPVKCLLVRTGPVRHFEWLSAGEYSLLVALGGLPLPAAANQALELAPDLDLARALARLLPWLQHPAQGAHE